MLCGRTSGSQPSTCGTSSHFVDKTRAGRPHYAFNGYRSCCRTLQCNCSESMARGVIRTDKVEHKSKCIANAHMLSECTLVVRTRSCSEAMACELSSDGINFCSEACACELQACGQRPCACLNHQSLCRIRGI